MKLAFAFSVVFSLLVPMTSYTAMPSVVDQDLFQSDITVPLWLHLPSNQYITSVENSGNPGEEASSGAVVLALPGDGEKEMLWLAASLKAGGYQVEDSASHLGQYVSTDGVAIATDSSTGRRVIMVRTQSQDGTILRVSYNDPQVLG